MVQRPGWAPIGNPSRSDYCRSEMLLEANPKIVDRLPRKQAVVRVWRWRAYGVKGNRWKRCRSGCHGVRRQRPDSEGAAANRIKGGGCDGGIERERESVLSLPASQRRNRPAMDRWACSGHHTLLRPQADRQNKPAWLQRWNIGRSTRRRASRWARW
jgi:hypothetical protein